MTSSIGMASNGLLLIGDSPISSFEEPGAGAQAMAAFYPDTYKAILAEHPWSFALKHQKLSQLAESPDPLTNFKFAYKLPTDLIRIWTLLSHSNYILINGLVYSNETEILCRYVYKVNETALPPHVVKAIEYKLASEAALAVTESESKAALYEKKYTLQIAKAKNIDSQGRPQEAIIDSPFTDIRGGGTGFGQGF